MWCTYKPDFSHIDPAHAFGSVRLPESNAVLFSQSSIFTCRYCELKFATADLRNSHEQIVHPPKPQPMLLINGMPLGRSRFKSFAPFFHEQISLYHFQKINLNGHLVSVDLLYDILSAPDNNVYRIELVGDKSKKTFEIEFEIMKPADINGVEAAFQWLCERGSDDKLLEAFRREALKFKTATSYFGALYDYLLGIKIKEGRGLTFESYEFLEKFERADAVLRRINRPLATTIHAIIKINQNNFDTDININLPKDIINNILFFKGGIIDEPVTGASSTPFVVPIDKATYWLLFRLPSIFSQLDVNGLLHLKKENINILRHPADSDKFDYYLYRKALAEKNIKLINDLKKRVLQHSSFLPVQTEGDI